MIIVASIPHTGTFFVADHLLGHLNRVPIGCDHENTVQVVHFNEPAIEQAWALIDRYPTIVPKREFSAVQESWRRRGLDLDELETLWRSVFPLRYPNMLLLQIDGPDRERQLQNIEQRIGHPLSTSWPVVNQLVA